MSTLLRFENLTLGYGRHPAVHHLSTEIARGSLTAIVGPNGAGKSSLLKAIAGEIAPMQGKLEWVSGGRHDIAWLTQQSALDVSFPLTVFDLVAMGLWRHTGAFGGIGEAGAARVHEALEAVGIAALASRPIGTLSGGQLQRARFARLMLQDAPLVLLDEPYAAIDTSTARDLARLVAQWHSEGRTVISVLHDLDHVREAYPQTLLLSRELIACGDTATVLTADNLARARRAAQIEEADIHAICREGESVAQQAREQERAS